MLGLKLNHVNKRGPWLHQTDVIMGTIASQITSLTIVYLTVYSDADQRKYERSASLAFVQGFHRRPVNSSHKWAVMRKMFPFDDVIMSMSYAIHVKMKEVIFKMLCGWIGCRWFSIITMWNKPAPRKCRHFSHRETRKSNVCFLCATSDRLL